MNLLLSGAREHGLPADYVRYVRSIALARDERGDTLGQLLLFARE